MSFPIAASFSASFPSKISVSSHSFDKPILPKTDDTTEAAFLKEAQKTPAERIHDAILKKLGITEEEFTNMDADGKSAVADAVKDEIMRQIQTKSANSSGNYIDMSV